MNNVLLGLAEPARKVVVLVVLAVAAVVYPAAGALAAETADACPNAAIRAQQDAQSLPDCRAYEQVTPVEKAGANVSLGKPSQGARLPGAIAYSLSTGLPGGPTNLAIGYYRAKRTATGWDPGFYDVPQRNPAYQLVFTTRWISSDLVRSVSASQVALTPDATDGATSVYVHDVDTGGSRLIAQESGDPLVGNQLYTDFMDVLPGPVFGATADLDHVVFDSAADLGDGATPGVANVWEWADGQLRLVNRMPDGTASPTGGHTGTMQAYATQTPRFISDDGSRIFFGAPLAAGYPTWALYVRENGTTTKLISHSQRAGADPTVPVTDAAFVGASADGRFAFFNSRTPLTDDAVGTPGSATWLYRADVDTDTITLVGGKGTSNQNKFGKKISADGQRIYFVTVEALVPGASADGSKLYLWDHGVLKLVSELNPDSANQSFAMSSDGRYMEFGSKLSPTGFDSTSAACPDPGTGAPGPCSEMYSYDAVTGATDCMSCAPAGASGGHATTGIPAQLFANGAYAPTAVLDDGTRIFETPTALVAADVNRKRDVYEWKDGRVRLLSTGVDRNDALYLDSSADGTDVYFATFGRLVAQDTDSARDIYSVRVGGGLAEQNAVRSPSKECTLDACQGSPAGPATPPVTGSLSFTGDGNALLPGVKPAAASVKVSKLKPVSGTSAMLRVTVPGAGVVSVSGVGVGSVKRSATKAGTVLVKVTLSATSKRTLAKKMTVKVKVRVGFVPRSGRSAATSVSVTFKRPTQSKKAKGRG
jgi:hypothetical protein